MQRRAEELEDLFGYAIVEMGIGGYVSTGQILEHYNPISAETFAKIAYATDAMPSIYGCTLEAVDAGNIEPVIQNNQFENKPHFTHLVDLFISRFGSRQEVTFK